jgi:hypothetical protein
MNRITRPSAAPVRKASRVQEHDRDRGAERRADPETAVDGEIGAAAIARRDQLLDRRVDRRIFTADAGAGEEAEDDEAREIPRRRRRGGGHEIDGERDEKQLLAAEPVGQPAEEQRTEHGARQIGAARDAHLDGGEMQDRALRQRAREGAGERHLEAVENPGDAERDDHESMEAVPRQPVEARRDVALDHGLVAASRRGSRRAGSGRACKPRRPKARPGRQLLRGKVAGNHCIFRISQLAAAPLGKRLSGTKVPAFRPLVRPRRGGATTA